MTTSTRVLVDAPADLPIVYYSGDDLIDPDGNNVAVTVTRADGTALLADQPATRDSTGRYHISLTAAQLGELDLLELTWSAAIGGQARQDVTEAEIVGAHLFTIAEARGYGRRALADEGAYPDAAIAEARDRITDDFEAICGWSFVPRYHRERRSGRGLCSLLLSKQRVQRILTVEIDGTALTADELAALEVDPEGVVHRTGGAVWPQGRRNITISYVHGWERPPPAIRTAALELITDPTASKLIPTDVSSRVLNTTDDSGATSYFATAGRGIGDGDIQHYGLPAVDSVLNRREYNGRHPGLA